MALSVSTALANNFIFEINKLPKVSESAKTAQLPDLTLGSMTNSTRTLDFKTPGTKIEFGSLVVTFTVDEDYENYMEVWNWIHELRKPPSLPHSDRLSDASLIILNNNKQPILKFKFVDCWPSSLAEIPYTMDEASAFDGIVTFEFSYVEQVKL